jgi:beta-glucosidase/6-phospho-beta-glucosidase/beta-galactosidase
VATPIYGVQAPRRSRRIAGIGVEFDLHKEKSKQVRKAMVALKCISENEEINNEALQEYAALFNRCLNQVQVEALSALFGWTLPADLES